MTIRRLAASFVTGFLWAALLPATASAQSAIAGTVTDNTGAVMPGVTVEAASPVLIEKVRIGDQRRPGPLHDHRSASRARIPSATACPASRRPSAKGSFLPGGLHRDGQHPAERRRARRERHGHGTEPAGGRAVVRAHRGDHARSARRAPDAAEHAVVRLPRAGRAPEQARRRRRADDGAGQHARARREPAPHDDADRRHAHQPGVQRRPHPELHQPGGLRGDGVHDELPGR